MRRGQTRMQYLQEQLQVQELEQERLRQQIEREQLQQEIYLRQVAAQNRKARTRRLIQIGAIFSNVFEAVEQYELDDIAAFLREIQQRGLEPRHIVNSTALSKMDR